MDSPFRPKSEDELMKLINESVAHISPEDCRDVDEFCDKLTTEYGLFGDSRRSRTNFRKIPD